MSNEQRRRLLKSIAAGGGAFIVGKSLPEKWVKPVLDSVVLPAHAQASPCRDVLAIGDVTIDFTCGVVALATGVGFIVETGSGCTVLRSEPGLFGNGVGQITVYQNTPQQPNLTSVSVYNSNGSYVGTIYNYDGCPNATQAPVPTSLSIGPYTLNCNVAVNANQVVISNITLSV